LSEHTKPAANRWWLVPRECPFVIRPRQEAAAQHKQEVQDCRDFMKRYHLIGSVEQCIAFKKAEAEETDEIAPECVPNTTGGCD
jgi:hypothetical protein